jgi:NADH-quinone oxidoreductase subunit H
VSEATLGDFAWKLPPLAVVFGGAMSVVALLVYLERKVSARIQSRIGPNRVGLLGPDGLAEGLLGLRLTRRRILGGLLQPLADVVKLFTKQDFTPGRTSCCTRWRRSSPCCRRF